MLKKMFVYFFMSLLTDYAKRGRQLVKIEGVRLYVQAVSSIRNLFLFVSTCLACLVIAQIGLAFAVYGIVTSFDLNIRDQSLAFIILGSVFLIVPIIGFMILSSEKLWAKKTGVPELVRAVMSKPSPAVELKLARRKKYGS